MRRVYRAFWTVFNHLNVSGCVDVGLLPQTNQTATTARSRLNKCFENTVGIFCCERVVVSYTIMPRHHNIASVLETTDAPRRCAHTRESRRYFFIIIIISRRRTKIRFDFCRREKHVVSDEIVVVVELQRYGRCHMKHTPGLDIIIL